MKLPKLNLDGYRWVCILYFAVAIFSWQLKYSRHIDNNYLIFQGAYFHLKDHLNLYATYPREYYDVFLYGPLFALFIAPMALLPHVLGFLMWEILNTVIFVYAVSLLPLANRLKMLILLFCAIEFANAVFYMEFNPIIAAIIILAFLLIKKQKDQLASLLIVVGTLMKLYPIGALAFFVFSDQKLKFIYWTAIWIIIGLCLPAIISGPTFLIQSYHDWYNALIFKNSLNIGLNSGQDWCLMGVVRRLLQDSTVPNWPFLLGGIIVFCIPLLRFSQYQSLKFQFQVLCSVLIMVVIFSTGSEHPTFIIATVGAVIYIMMQQKPFTPLNIVFLILLIIVTGLGPSDAFPKFMRVWMAHYAMKAWPCILIWGKLAFELIFKDFTRDKFTPLNFGNGSIVKLKV